MSATEDCVEAGDCGTYPTFALRALVDDPEDPTEVTFYPADAEEITTEWLTADRGSVLAIEELR
ncbi:MAG: hypothetical protein ABEI39_05735 [Halobacteriales archaeon]